MLQNIAIVLVILWILGVVTSNTIGGFIHILFVIAMMVFVLKIIKSKKIF